MIEKAHQLKATVRLTTALASLSQRSPSVGPVTVTQLCELAGVSRNSLYRYHTSILASLRKLQGRRRNAAPSSARRVLKKRRAENVSLKAMNEKLAALVDHYWAAYQEAGALLARRERELAQLRRGFKSTPTLVRS